MKTRTLILLSVVGAGALKAVKYFAGIKNTGDKLETVTTVRLLPIKLGSLSLTLQINVTLKNPTEGELTIRQPYVKILFNNKDIGTSQLSNKVFVIPPYVPKDLDPIFLTIPATGLLTLGDGLFKVLLRKQPAQITTLTTTSVKVAGVFMSQTKTDVSTLKPIIK